MTAPPPSLMLAYARRPLPRVFMLPFLACCSLACVGQMIYSARTGVIYWGHAGGGGYKAVLRDREPRKFRLLLWAHAAFALLFLAALTVAFFLYRAS